MLVHSDGQAQPAFLVISAEGNRLVSTVPTSELNDGPVTWVELVPRPGQDEIALLYADQNADLVAILWDGDQWLNETATALETELKRNAARPDTVSNRVFDAAYEALSGELLVVWGNHDIEVNSRWTRKSPGQPWAAEASSLATPTRGLPHHVELVAQPGSDRIVAVLADMGDDFGYLGLATWDGDAWSIIPDEERLDGQNIYFGDFPAAGAWVGAEAICVFADNQLAGLEWQRWNGTWGPVARETVAGKQRTESVAVASTPAHDGLFVALSDQASRLYTGRYDHAGWTVDATSLTAVSRTTSVPFSLDLGR